MPAPLPDLSELEQAIDSIEYAMEMAEDNGYIENFEALDAERDRMGFVLYDCITAKRAPVFRDGRWE